MQPRMCFDDVAWETSEKITDDWVAGVFSTTTLRAIGDFIVKHRGGGIPTELCQPRAGGFNLSFRMKFEDGGSALIRFPKPGASMFPEEKVRNEVAVIRYIQEHTSIPVPFILHWGMKADSPLGLGPFILMEYIDHEMDLGAALNSPELAIEDRPILDPFIDMDKLEMLYSQLADILLQLSKLTFPRIGSLEQIDDIAWSATRRPLSIHLNELVRLGTLPRSKLLKTTYDTSSSYFEALAQLHIDHLVHQRNDAVHSAIDCRRKFVARKLFQRLAQERKLTSSTHDAGPFKLWCDDFRPSNVLVNANLQIVGVVDWEFTYAAPVEFSTSPPWWLLLEQPEYWPDGGIEMWARAFEKRLRTFLKVLVEREDFAIRAGRLTEDQRLSGPMRQSWETGDFWITYAARKNFAFDAVFWQSIDSRFFGPGTEMEDRWRDRLGLLSDQERKDMESLVTRKLQEMEDRVLKWEPDELEVVLKAMDAECTQLAE